MKNGCILFGFFCVILLLLAPIEAQSKEIFWEKNRKEAEAYSEEIGAPLWYFFSDFDQHGNIWEGHLDKLDKKAGEFMQGNRTMVFGHQTTILSDKAIVELSKYFVCVFAESTGVDASEYPGITYCSIVFVDSSRNAIGKVIGGEMRTVGYFFKANEVAAEMEKSLQNLGLKEPISWYEMMFAQQKEAERALEAGETEYAITVLEDLKTNAKKSCYGERATTLIKKSQEPKGNGGNETPEEHHLPPSQFQNMIDEAREVYIEDPAKAIKILKTLLHDAPKEEESREEAEMMLEAILSDNPELKSIGVDGKKPEKIDPKKQPEVNPATTKNANLPKPYTKKGQGFLEIAKQLYRRNLYQKAFQALNQILETESGTRIVWEVKLIKSKMKAVPQVHDFLNSSKIRDDIKKMFEEVQRHLSANDKKKALKKLEEIIKEYPDADDTEAAYAKIQELGN